MDYEKAYKEALERADTLTEKYGGRDFAEYVFPELAESEDERIRKALVEYHKQQFEKNRDQEIGLFHKDALAYLEKQKEQKPIIWNIYDEGKVDILCDLIQHSGWAKPTINEFIEWLKSFRPQCSNKDFEKEVIDYWKSTDWRMSISISKFQVIARYFYGLGLSAKEQKPVQSDEEREYVRVLKSLISDFIRDNYKTTDISFYQQIYDWLDGRHIEQKPAEWSEEDEKILDSLIRLYSREYSEYVWPWANGDITYGDVVNFLKSLRPQSKEELAKMLQDEYNKGKETGEREGYTKGYNKGYKDANGSVSYHFPVMPTPSSGFGCDGTHCTNPQMDCINCPKKSTGGMFNTASSSGDLTLKADWKPSEDEERLINTSISFLKDFADKGYENAVECIDWLKSKLNGNTCK